MSVGPSAVTLLVFLFIFFFFPFCLKATVGRITTLRTILSPPAASPSAWWRQGGWGGGGGEEGRWEDRKQFGGKAGTERETIAGRWNHFQTEGRCNNKPRGRGGSGWWECGGIRQEVETWERCETQQITWAALQQSAPRPSPIYSTSITCSDFQAATAAAAAASLWNHLTSPAATPRLNKPFKPSAEGSGEFIFNILLLFFF